MGIRAAVVEEDSDRRRESGTEPPKLHTERQAKGTICRGVAIVPEKPRKHDTAWKPSEE